MVTLCSWCGKYLTGQPVATGKGIYSTWGTEKPIIVEYEVGFCCHGCAWAWGIKEHKMMGITGDEARKLCLALNIDLEDTVIGSKKLLTKKGKNVTIQLPKARRKRGMVDPDVEVFDCVLDAAHTAMLIFEEDGGRACERWVRQRRLERDQRFTALLQAMANAIPVTKKKGEYIRPEIAILDRMNDALGLGITFPTDPEPDLKAIQIDLFKTARVAEERADYEEDEENEDLDEEDGDGA